MTRTLYTDYLECAREARQYATQMRMDVVIRKVTEFGRKGFLYHLKSNDGSDYLAETIHPGEPL
jgi:hypothetical protein